ncbi:MAG TPA: hypothetical protein VKU36_02790 [Candidatus Babeliales bacterium]|nr:hypothetical protein [Candidatus Babeliales bacterium]
MNKAFFVALMLNGCMYASQPTESTSLFTRKNSYSSQNKIDVDSIIKSSKSDKSHPAFMRVRRQSSGSDDFRKATDAMKFAKEENRKSERGRSESK